MVELLEIDEQIFIRKSSKGNQMKWEKDDMWYKADFTGYEGLTEYLISQLLVYSTLNADEFVIYNTEEIKYKKQKYLGCSSKDFLKKGWQIITLERLFEQNFGWGLHKSLYSIEDHEGRICFLVQQVERITGLVDFGKYMSKIITIDALFLNEDRHTHNIAVLMDKNGNFDYCPIFDNGAGLLSDTTVDYPLNEDIYPMIKQVKSKTFLQSFDEQLDYVEKYYGHNLYFGFSKKDVEEILAEEQIYPQDIKERVKNIIYYQMDKYQYLFRK